MNRQDAELRYGKAISDLTNGVEQMKIFGKELGLSIDEIELDVVKAAELD